MTTGQIPTRIVARLTLIFVAAVLLMAGCATTSTSKSGNKSGDAVSERSKGTQIKLGGDGLNLGEIQQTSMRPDMLEQIVGKLISERRYQSARQWVLRYPDVALDLMRGLSSKSKAAVFIAKIHDQQRRTVGNGGWSAAMTFQQANASQAIAFNNKRGQVFAALRSGNLTEATSVDLLGTLPESTPVPIRLEALRLHGVTLLVNSQHDDAAKVFEDAITLAGTDHPYEASHLRLLASDARRRSGGAEAAQSHWREAVMIGASLLSGATPIEDPVFWERAVYLRPRSIAWPTELQQQLSNSLASNRSQIWQTDLSALPVSSDAIESLVWSNVGIWRITRQEAQGAMVALQKGDVLAQSESIRNELRLHQARALAQLGQNTPAMSLLVGLMNKNTPVGRSALAIAGVMSLEQGQVQRGISLLKRAMDSSQVAPWPGRRQAEADLGLAYLIVGDEEKGFEYLQRIQRDANDANVELKIKSLRNELRYAEATGKPKSSILSRLLQIEGSGI